MKRIAFISFLLISISANAQPGWKVTTIPAGTTGRIDDVYMVSPQTGYAVNATGKIFKTTDYGENWTLIKQDANIYNRACEFINEQKGFVGGFPQGTSTANVLRRTTDGGATWTDLTNSIPVQARSGICGISIADANTIYAGGAWFLHSGYIIKSTDGGDSWNLIDMSPYASSIIDLQFISKDTGFATGRGKLPFESAIILYTADGGATWTTKFENIEASEFVWKIQRLTPRIWYASIEDLINTTKPKVLKSIDGGMTWSVQIVSQTYYNIEGIGFIDPLHGWTGGEASKSFETKDGGRTWTAVPNLCPLMNRVFRVSDTMLLATGTGIWKYKNDGIFPPVQPQHTASMVAYPNPVRNILTLDVATTVDTRIYLALYDASGRKVKDIENANRGKGSYHYYVDTKSLQEGIYIVGLKTHEDKGWAKIVVAR